MIDLQDLMNLHQSNLFNMNRLVIELMENYFLNFIKRLQNIWISSRCYSFDSLLHFKYYVSKIITYWAGIEKNIRDKQYIKQYVFFKLEIVIYLK